MDIFSLNELLLVAFVALLVIGPERLPETLRTLGLWIGRLTRSFNSVKAELEKEIGMDDIRRQLHNEAIMEEMKRIEEEVNSSMDVEQTTQADDASENSIAPPTAPDPDNPSTQDQHQNDNHDDAGDFANEPLTDIPPPLASESLPSGGTPTDKANRADNA